MTMAQSSLCLKRGMGLVSNNSKMALGIPACGSRTSPMDGGGLIILMEMCLQVSFLMEL